jgi:predicted metal-dependent hydrolase
MIQELLQFNAEVPPDRWNIDGTEVAIQWRRKPNARRYILRFQRPPCVLATIPRGGSKREAWAFLQRNRPWLQRQLAKTPPAPRAWEHGTEIWFRGAKTPIRIEGDEIRLAEETISLGVEIKLSILRHFQKLAFKELVPRTIELARQTNTEIKRIVVRNQRSRWGSCSLKRTISLNWRLIQTPPHVSDYIILHELMHLRQMNHSARFWAEVEKVCPAWGEAEKWLKQNSRDIMPG